MEPSPSKGVLATHFKTVLGTDWNPMYPSDFHTALTVQEVEDLLKDGAMPRMSALKDADGVEWVTGPRGCVPRGTKADNT